MDAYFCYIHRDAKPIAEMKILAGDSRIELGRQLGQLIGDYPAAQLEIFQGDRLVARLDTGQGATRADNIARAIEALALAVETTATQGVDAR